MALSHELIATLASYALIHARSRSNAKAAYACHAAVAAGKAPDEDALRVLVRWSLQMKAPGPEATAVRELAGQALMALKVRDIEREFEVSRVARTAKMLSLD